MGNEASLEGGEAGLPAGLAPDGKGGFIQMPAGTEADLSNLSEEERKQLVAAVAKAQSRQVEEPPEAGGGKAPVGLSKSRTVDAFGEGPPPKPKPGRSPSSLSLLESRFRQEPKDPEQPRTGMFSSGFLSGANPLSAVSSAVSSASIPKFSLFGDEEEEEAAKQEGNGPPQAELLDHNSKGLNLADLLDHNSKGLNLADLLDHNSKGLNLVDLLDRNSKVLNLVDLLDHNSKVLNLADLLDHNSKVLNLADHLDHNSKVLNLADHLDHNSKGLNLVDLLDRNSKVLNLVDLLDHNSKVLNLADLLDHNSKVLNLADHLDHNSKVLNLADHLDHNSKGLNLVDLLVLLENPVGFNSRVNQDQMLAKDQPPNYNTCTQCRQQVCSLCGFSPPDSAGKEWLCLNCQMQRAVGGMEPPGPPMMKQPPKQGSAPHSPQRKDADPGKKPPMLTKQKSIVDTGKGGTPPTTPKPGAQPAPQLGQQTKRGLPPPLQKPTQSPKGSPQPSPAKTTPKQDGGGFFGGFGLGGLTEAQGSDSVTGKLFSGFGASKPQGGAASQASESVTGKLFSGFSGMTESAKPSAGSPQTTESVSGKMFGFGSSIFSSATNLISGEESKSPPASPPGSPPDSPIGSEADSPPGSPPDSGSDSPPETPPAYSKETASPKPEGKPSTDTSMPKLAGDKESPAPISDTEAQSCPLCKVKLNLGSGEVSNYSTCTECQKTVCNLCGFNPTPHLSEGGLAKKSTLIVGKIKEYQSSKPDN
ncbi:hypothetical protein DNTS_018401 [Danionella cerebrum]|uniref:Zinc finger piccolo-type domain-containing protein n=1 Tax=Danionella cerebrum TaxID=2873325 RepID=A0A553QWN5_9TELE|nr:hypothetical protein DNTS_018401 [Danionella translucida]